MSKVNLKPICFWCGKEIPGVTIEVSEEDKKEIDKILEENKDREGVFLDYTPCEHCMKYLKDNVMVIKVSENAETSDQPPIIYSEEKDKSYYPTGEYMLIPDEIIKNTMVDPVQRQTALELRSACMIENDFNSLKNFLDQSLGIVKELDNINEQDDNNEFVQ